MAERRRAAQNAIQRAAAYALRIAQGRIGEQEIPLSIRRLVLQLQGTSQQVLYLKAKGRPLPKKSVSVRR